MEDPVLTNKDQFPTDEVVFSHIGKSGQRNWERLFDHVRSSYPDFAEQWRYYKDGQSWLLKVVRKSKTIFWVSVIAGSFRAAFYFGDKAEAAILGSGISADLKDSFKHGKRYGKVRGITVAMKNKTNLNDVIELIEIKLRQK